jgi:hypothetical protein
MHVVKRSEWQEQVGGIGVQKSVNYNTYREAARSVQENPDDSMEVEYWGEVKIL